MCTNQVFASPALYQMHLPMHAVLHHLKMYLRTHAVPHCTIALLHACSFESSLPLFRPEPGLLQSLIFASKCNFPVNGMLCHSLETLRESRILWHFIEPSFAFGASLSHFLPHCSLFFILFGGCVHACRPEGLQ